jgi:transcriptional regulator with PAS, ATPase and Fis domain
LTSAAEKKLLEYKWPGNVRELLNVIERAMIFADKDKKYLSGDDIIIKPIFEDIYREHFPIPRGIPLSEAEKEYIRLTLEWTNYDYSKAAEILGITTKTLWEKRRKYGLK